METTRRRSSSRPTSIIYISSEIIISYTRPISITTGIIISKYVRAICRGSTTTSIYLRATTAYTNNTSILEIKVISSLEKSSITFTARYIITCSSYIPILHSYPITSISTYTYQTSIWVIIYSFSSYFICYFECSVRCECMYHIISTSRYSSSSSSTISITSVNRVT